MFVSENAHINTRVEGRKERSQSIHKQNNLLKKCPMLNEQVEAPGSCLKPSFDGSTFGNFKKHFQWDSEIST